MYDWKKAERIIKEGGVGVVPTDTLYGVVGSALNANAVERIYAVRQRDLHKPLIILVASQNDLSRFGIQLTGAQEAFLNNYWPGPVSVILPCQSDRFAYLHRGTGALAVRLPDSQQLSELIATVGPIVAPSANPQGQPPAETVEEARAYFGDRLDFYVDGGRLAGQPSTLVDLTEDKPRVLRGQL